MRPACKVNYRRARASSTPEGLLQPSRLGACPGCCPAPTCYAPALLSATAWLGLVKHARGRSGEVLHGRCDRLGHSAPGHICRQAIINGLKNLGVPMSAAHVVVTLLAIAANTFSGVAAIVHLKPILPGMARAGVPESWLTSPDRPPKNRGRVGPPA